MSDKDGSLSLKIGFEIDEAELAKLVSDTTTKFSRSLGSSIYNAISEFNLEKIKLPIVGISDHTGASSSVITGISKDVKEILRILRSKPVGEGFSSVMSQISTGVNIRPTQTDPPIYGNISMLTDSVYLKQYEESQAKILVEQKRQGGISKLRSSLEAEAEKSEKEKADIEAMGPGEKYQYGSIMPAYDKETSQQYMVRDVDRYLRDEEWRKTQKPPFQIYNPELEKWVDLELTKGMILLHQPGETPQDIIKKLSEIGGTKEFKELQEFMRTSAGKKALENLKHVYATVYDTGKVSLSLISYIKSQATKMTEGSKELTRLIDDALRTVIMDETMYRDFEPMFYDMLMAYAGDNKKRIADIFNDPRILFNIYDVIMTMTMGGLGTTYKERIDKDIVQARFSMTSRERLLEYGSHKREYNRMVGLSPRRQKTRAFKEFYRVPEDIRSPLLAGLFDSGQRSDVIGNELRVLKEQSDRILSIEDEDERIEIINAIKEENKEIEKNASKDKELLDKIWRQRNLIIGQANTHFQLLAETSKVDELKRAVGIDWYSYGKMIQRRFLSPEERDKELLESTKIEDAVRRGDIIGVSDEDRRKFMTAYLIARSGRGITAMHTSARTVFEGGIPYEQDILNFELTGSPFTTTRHGVGPTPITDIDTIHRMREIYVRELG